jgi:galactose mutarotase-like enzyme
MLADCTFQLPQGPFAPLARATWMGTVTDTAISGHLRELGGDFVCLPFGRARAVPDAPADWSRILTKDETGLIHGPAADAEWSVDSATSHAITLSLPYNEPSPVARLTRSISARENAPALDMNLTIHARRAATVSVGLHPILRLPGKPGRLHLAADFAFGLTHPAQTPPGIGQDFASLASVPRPGGVIDMSHVPLTPRTDLNVQLCGMQSPLTATYMDEGAGLIIDWDRYLLPSLQIWHTDRGIGGVPWHNQYRGIGLEPVCAAFDLGDWAANSANPIAARGVSTALAITPDHPVAIRYSFAAFAT